MCKIESEYLKVFIKISRIKSQLEITINREKLFLLFTNQISHLNVFLI